MVDTVFRAVVSTATVVGLSVVEDAAAPAASAFPIDSDEPFAVFATSASDTGGFFLNLFFGAGISGAMFVGLAYPTPVPSGRGTFAFSWSTALVSSTADASDEL